MPIDPLLPLRVAAEQLLAAAHTLIAGTVPATGAAWLLAEVVLVVLVRAALLPLAVA